MPDFKIVVNDPEAPKKEKVVKVKVEGDPEIQITDKVKEKLELPVFKVNSKTASEIGAVHGVATIRMWRPDTGDKVKFTGRIIIDDNVPDSVVKVSMEQLINATGQNELEGEIFRARAWQIRINDERTQAITGLKIGDYIDGSIIGLKGVKLAITGGSDISGFPMRPDISGPVKKKVLLSGPPGFHPEEDGERRRKTVRGNTIAPDIVQINTKIVYESK
ncbi:30S ribosomal protein S6e [Desulfurococcus amylolyticus]|uniref:Small ribosomal subunit protein eS6 n=1 Tax=Desulfurococcus amylolyticus DSM 16532 TaxID=768672 RepID=I3XTN5_DESAM|nr:30S ribosomal protein S6e [Desulfurococcus amylolyticus]AFL67309.1 Ribosomal protein S6e [Desulfurococcus amylolyticus DSM 16532]